MEWTKIDEQTYQYDEGGVRFFLLTGTKEAYDIGLAATVLLGTSIGKLLKAGIIRKGAKLLI